MGFGINLHCSGFMETEIADIKLAGMKRILATANHRLLWIIRILILIIDYNQSFTVIRSSWMVLG